MDNKPYQTEWDQLPENVKVTAQLFGTLAQTIFSYFNDETIKISPLNFMILMDILGNPGTSMSELAKRVGISKPQLSRSVSKLEDLHMIKRVHNTENRRNVNVYPDKEGSDLMAQQFLRVANRLDKTLSALSSEDRARLVPLMTESLEILSKAGIVQQ
ncbi:MarR family winged helix-turn-helix transcriptional regulator [Pediococcus pentosaceus]|jgi:MarR family transcriptional regulator for hemolysin|uniref:MarR family winged helix-turn-helix transcriptional regulator n=1 Tax=Pediococcus pentosaceus TaxID=1255 RepID=UPI00110904F2|nr:MarR family transcriptional regulator [Pediococcus pentosaceus]KAF0423149.1 MarR family transcriptional regulator [Pediococcus pentosaceus]MBF7130021.1 MarR family transcriptional regulator [Pediococcus pentosaceus]MBF7135822.1 MarR family transcriptional regulator [Pediococcus pentosaceus]MDD1386985.1 MarR family transcriptional regulator [Pediococcus pentosaceus]QGZ70935.1 MarR family transcriptional regulator [Pediococcus pentosaceus]